VTARIVLEDQRVRGIAQFTVSLLGTVRIAGEARFTVKQVCLLLSRFYPSVLLYAAGALNYRIAIKCVDALNQGCTFIFKASTCPCLRIALRTCGLLYDVVSKANAK
jgi:hypothetical protein